jgi:hypothetical protein
MLRLAAVRLTSYVKPWLKSCVWGDFAFLRFAYGSRHAGSGASHHRFALMLAASPTGMSRLNEVA